MWAYRSNGAGGDSGSATVTVSDGCSGAMTTLQRRVRPVVKQPGRRSQLAVGRPQRLSMTTCSDSLGTDGDDGTDSLPNVTLRIEAGRGTVVSP